MSIALAAGLNTHSTRLQMLSPTVTATVKSWISKVNSRSMQHCNTDQRQVDTRWTGWTLAWLPSSPSRVQVECSAYFCYGTGLWRLLFMSMWFLLSLSILLSFIDDEVGGDGDCDTDDGSYKVCHGNFLQTYLKGIGWLLGRVEMSIHLGRR